MATLDLSKRLNQALENRGVALDESESDSVEVISRLIDSVVADPLVGSNVKHRVRRLAVPLLKLALEDESLFVDQAHPARQVMNRLGALELPSKRDNSEGASLRADVDPLIDRVARSESASAQAFSDVLPALDALLEAQNEGYNANAAKVVRAREEQARLSREARANDPTRARRATQAVPPEWQRWLNRAKHIQAGDALRIDEHGSGNPRLMRLAWKDYDDSAFQFVDGAGNKGASLSQQELAMYLRRGWAERVEDASLPVMERGVFRMLEGMHSKLSEEVARDRVTGLAHRRVFEAQLARGLEAAGYDEGVVVGLMDLDGFKKLNERIGKKAGNNLLKQMGKVLDKHIPGERSAARLDADDFAWMMEESTPEEAHKLADRMRRAIASSSCVWKGEKIPLSVSIGLAASSPQLASGGSMVEAAKAACAAAKRGGGNRVIDYGEGLAENLAEQGERTHLTKGLLDAGRLMLRQQMVKPLGEDKKRKPHFEILPGVRNRDGTAGDQTAIVLQAEKADEVRAIDHWVITETLAWMSLNRGAVAKSGGYAINLTGQSLSNPKLLPFVVEKLTETKVPPGKIVFEITESAAIDGLSEAAQFIRTLREYGCRFSIDNFGVGHAPFAYLKTLPVDYVKIDGMFVREVASNSKDYGLVKSMSDTAHLLGKQSIAEHVDSKEVLESLREIGIDFVQGLAVSKPTLLE